MCDHHDHWAYMYGVLCRIECEWATQLYIFCVQEIDCNVLCLKQTRNELNYTRKVFFIWKIHCMLEGSWKKDENKDYNL